MKKDYQKIKYQLNSEIKEQHKKRYQEFQAPITFAQYTIEACINAVSDFLNMKNIKFSLHSCIIQ